MTLVVQGLSLPLLIKLLGVKPHPVQLDVDEERELRLLMANSALNFIDNELPLLLSDHIKTQIRKPYIETIASLSKQLRVHDQEIMTAGTSAILNPQLAAQQEIHKFQRKILIGFHKEGTFNQSAIRRLEQELDHAELFTSKLVKKKNMF